MYDVKGTPIHDFLARISVGDTAEILKWDINPTHWQDRNGNGLSYTKIKIMKDDETRGKFWAEVFRSDGQMTGIPEPFFQGTETVDLKAEYWVDKDYFKNLEE